MFRSDKTKERQLFAYTPRDMIPGDSDVHLYNELFEQLDLKAFENDYSPQGQDSVEPRLMLRTIFYGLTHGIASGRKLEASCTFDNRFLVLSGGQEPCYRTFSRFLKRHQVHIDEVFVQIVHHAMKIGLVSLGQVAIDGTRIKANTSNHRTMKVEKLERAMDHITAELAKLRSDLEQMDDEAEEANKIPKELRNREVRLQKIKEAKERIDREAKEKAQAVNLNTQVSLNDPEARSLGSKKEKFIMGYNCQAAADSKHQIIVAADICDNTNDSVAFSAVVDEVIKVTEKVPEKILADAGYLSLPNIRKAAEVGAEAILSPRKLEEKSRLADVKPVEEPKIAYECNAGIVLKQSRIDVNGREAFKVTIPLEECKKCIFSAECSLYKSGKKSLRIMNHRDRETMLNHIKKTETEVFKEVYKRRKAIIEPIFGNIKTCKRLSIQVRGRSRVLSWWKMACTALNIEKIVKSMEISIQSPQILLIA